MLFAKKGSLFFRFFSSTLHAILVTIFMVLGLESSFPFLSQFAWWCVSWKPFFTVEAAACFPMQIAKKHFVVCQNSSSKGEKLLPKSCKPLHLLVNLWHLFCFWHTKTNLFFFAFRKSQNLHQEIGICEPQKKSYLHSLPPTLSISRFIIMWENFLVNVHHFLGSKLSSRFQIFLVVNDKKLWGTGNHNWLELRTWP